ncbi:MAG TPA: PD-(D/E)XK nuclease family protein [Candidatus Glassbacteria bacterium]|nr:PD-(D/E)XK nuclease family protein [Candidatus Glassbacteria bacterium]
MNDYSFTLDNMRFSYSSANNFTTCRRQFYLSYIEYADRKPNFFSDFGLYCHDILEKYFARELEIWDLEDYYVDNYGEGVQNSPPPYPKGMADQYYQDGLEFFANFDFDLNAYDVVSIEDKIDATVNDIDLVIKPDLVLRENATGKYSLVDYKTSKLKFNKYDEDKIAGYMKQFYLYSHFLKVGRDIDISTITVWFIRNNYIMNIDVDPIKMQETIDWFFGVIKDIKKEEDWETTTDKKTKFFCQWLCGCRDSCDKVWE